MGSLKVTLRTAAVLAVTALTPATYAANTAHAAEGGGGAVSVTPATPVPGADIALRVSGCTGKTAVAVSEAFVSSATLVETHGTLFGETRIRSTIAVGSYAVQINCADVKVKDTIEVVEGAPQPRPFASPVAPVHAGGGGTAHLADAATDATADADEARRKAPGAAQAVTGLALAGVAATVVALRGAARRRSRGTD